MRYNVRRWLAGAVGAVLVGTATVALSAPLGTLEAPQVQHITLGQYNAQRAYEGEEDTDAWDCRINDNTQCGDTWYELVCPDAPQVPTLLCTLEPHKL